MKYLIVSHAHPDYSVGGAEIAAYNLFRAISNEYPQSDTIFLARVDSKSLGEGSISQKTSQEFVWRQNMGSWFYLQTAYPESIFEAFRGFLLLHRPDVMFVQHYAHIGVEMFREIKKTLPNCRIVLTLHEYVAICNRNGQMLKAKTNRLCYRESIDDCNICFPEISPEEFWLRKNYIKKHFACVDLFVSPSEFLRQRYIAWGIDAMKISVIENGQPELPVVKQVLDLNQTRQRFAFFGQVTEYKGLDIFLTAISQLSPEIKKKASFEVHGANLDHQGQWLKERINSLVSPLLADGSLRWAGPYGREEFLQRISKVDWVVVPSIWWENSPMIIQEAFVCKKPVICSNIGGMAEKVRDGIDGIHFDVSSAFDLAEKLVFLIENPDYRKVLVGNIKRALTYSEAAAAYLNLQIAS